MKINKILKVFLLTAISTAIICCGLYATYVTVIQPNLLLILSTISTYGIKLAALIAATSALSLLSYVAVALLVVVGLYMLHQRFSNKSAKAAVGEVELTEKQKTPAAAPVAAPASSEATLEASPAESTAIVAVGSFGGSPAPAAPSPVAEVAAGAVIGLIILFNLAFFTKFAATSVLAVIGYLFLILADVSTIVYTTFYLCNSNPCQYNQTIKLEKLPEASLVRSQKIVVDDSYAQVVPEPNTGDTDESLARSLVPNARVRILEKVFLPEVCIVEPDKKYKLNDANIMCYSG